MTPSSSSEAPRPAVEPGRYRHWSGKEYVVVDIATHSETNQPVVVYRSAVQGRLYVRPLIMFTSDVKWPDGSTMPRFVRIADQDTPGPADAECDIRPTMDALASLMAVRDALEQRNHEDQYCWICQVTWTNLGEHHNAGCALAQHRAFLSQTEASHA